MSGQELILLIFHKLVIVFVGVVCGVALAKYRNDMANRKDE